MNRIIAAAVVAFGVGTLPLGAHADTFTSDFGALRTELEHRRDDDLSGTLDKTGKKQLKAVLKAIKFLDKDADDLGDDIKTSGKVFKALRKAFAGEFSVGLHGDSLQSLLEDVFESLQDRVVSDTEDLDLQLGGLSVKGQAKLQVVLDKIEATLGGADTSNFVQWAKAVFKSYKFTLKGSKILDKDPAATVSFNVAIDGVPSNPDTIAVTYSGVSGTLTIGATREDLGGYLINLVPDAAVFAPGEFGLSSALVTVTTNPPDIFTAESGTLNVTVLDTGTRRIAGNFSFTADSLQSGGSITVTGSLDVTYTSAD